MVEVSLPPPIQLLIYQIAREAAKRAPSDTLVHSAFLPPSRALIEMNHGRGEKAVEVMESAKPYDHTRPGLRRVRGLSYLVARRGPEMLLDEGGEIGRVER